MFIQVLGPVRLSTSHGDLVTVPERKVRALLATLVASHGEVIPADTLIDRVWGDDQPGNPKSVLRAKLSQLRSLLDRAQSGARDALKHSSGGYRLSIDPNAIDAHRFHQQVDQARRLTQPTQRAEALATALDLWNGEPYADVADGIWLTPTITSLRESRLSAQEEQAQALLKSGSPELVLERLAEVALKNPTRERLVSHLMLALYQVGRQHEALALYESLRQQLADELGADPSPPVRELHQRILRHDTGLASPELEPKPAHTNVPAEISPLIGRHDDVASILTLLSQNRLLTLNGVGGIGKTRLALHIARHDPTQYERGTWFVDLTELAATAAHTDSPERIAALVASALQLPERDKATSVVQQLCDSFGSSTALIVLDNCEHVLGEVTSFVSELLRHCEGVRILSTTRESLALPEEQQFSVTQLNVDAPSEEEPSEAASFFAIRAQAIDSSFQLDSSTTAVVNELCDRLDGLPLALELAAGRIKALSIRDLLDRTTDRLNLLSRPGRGVPRRQQTLRGMIDWSWSLLESDQQVVLRRLAVHPGTWSLSAIESICSDPPSSTNHVDSTAVLDIVMRLVEQSMVSTVATASGIRYHLLESIATYGAEKLVASGERETTARRHLEYYRDLVIDADRQFRGPNQAAALRLFEREWSHIQLAKETALDLNDGDNAASLMLATFWYRWMTGRHRNLLDNVEAVLACPGLSRPNVAILTTLAAILRVGKQPDQAVVEIEDALRLFDNDDHARASVHWFAATALMGLGHSEKGEAEYQAAISTLAEIGDDWTLAFAVSSRDWFMAYSHGEPPQQQLPDGRDITTVFEELGDQLGLALRAGLNYRYAELTGDHVTASKEAERAAQLSRSLEVWSETSYWLAVRSSFALREGHPELAENLLREARSLSAAIGYSAGTAFVDFHESTLARYLGDIERSRQLLDHWLRVGDIPASDVMVQFEVGFLSLREGDLAQAQSALRTLPSAIGSTDQPVPVARMLELWAGTEALFNRPADAARILGTAHQLRNSHGNRLNALEEADRSYIWELIGAQLDEDSATAGFREGQDQDYRELVKAISC